MCFQRLCFESVTAAYILSIAFCLQWNSVASMGTMNKDVITLTLVNTSLSVERGILQNVTNRTITVFEGSNLTFQCESSNTDHARAGLGWTIFLGNVLHVRVLHLITTPTFSLHKVVPPSILEVHNLKIIDGNNHDSYVICGLPDYTGGPDSYSFASHRTTIRVQGLPVCPRFENRVSPYNVSWTDNTVGPLSVYYTVAVNSTGGVSTYNVTESTFSIPVNISQSNSCSYSVKVEACVLGQCSPNCPWINFFDDDNSIVLKGPPLNATYIGTTWIIVGAVIGAVVLLVILIVVVLSGGVLFFRCAKHKPANSPVDDEPSSDQTYSVSADVTLEPSPAYATVEETTSQGKSLYMNI